MTNGGKAHTDNHALDGSNSLSRDRKPQGTIKGSGKQTKPTKRLPRDRANTIPNSAANIPILIL
jgi:hypothetical protein